MASLLSELGQKWPVFSDFRLILAAAIETLAQSSLMIQTIQALQDVRFTVASTLLL